MTTVPQEFSNKTRTKAYIPGNSKIVVNVLKIMIMLIGKHA